MKRPEFKTQGSFKELNQYIRGMSQYANWLEAENAKLTSALELKAPVLEYMEQDINKIKADKVEKGEL